MTHISGATDDTSARAGMTHTSGASDDTNAPPAMTQTAAEPRPVWPGRLVSIGAGEVFVRSTSGTGGEPAMFVHGLGGSSTNWTDLMGLLDGQLDGDAIDLPGFGFSPPPADGNYTISAHARAVMRLIEQRGRGPVHLFGNSLGGAVCTRLAARRPDLIRTLTLISPALPDVRPRRETLRLSLLFMPLVGVWLMERARAVPAPARAAAIAEIVFFDPQRMHPVRREEEAAELARRDRLDYTEAVFLGSARAVMREYFRRGQRSLWHEAARVSAPVLAIFGTHDRLVHHRIARQVSRRFPISRSVVLMETGHVAQMERPREVATEVRAFLRDYQQAASAPGTGNAPARAQG